MLYCSSQSYWWRNPEYPEKTTDLSQVTDKDIVVSSTPRLNGIRTLVVIGIDCIGSCKSNYHALYLM
jgi:hypothetical protein